MSGVREVLELVELGDQFPWIRQEALDGVEQPEPPPDVVQREGRMTDEEEAGFARECAAARMTQRHGTRERPAEAGRQVVNDHDALALIDERVNHVAADIAGAAGDQDGHIGPV
jgi:hypothetical protein